MDPANAVTGEGSPVEFECIELFPALFHVAMVECDRGPKSPFSLTKSEIRVLAKQHIRCVYDFAAYMKTGGYASPTDYDRVEYHKMRYAELLDELGEQDKEYFRNFCGMADKHIATLRDPEED